jgi:aminoglycoside 2''-phosphotransferase
MTPVEVAAAILQKFPDWQIDSMDYLGEGDFCAAYLVNDEWLFRVGKHQEARASLGCESCLLPDLASALTLQIPVPKFAALDEQTTLPFVGYRFLPGPALSQARYLNLDNIRRTRCAEAVADFLNQLHAHDLKPARACGVPVIDYTARYGEILRRARAHLYPILDEPERRFIERLMTGYLSSGDASSFRQVLLHGDLSPDHVLFDEASQSVSAIIDFGDMMIGDPAWDLVFIYEDYGLDFFARLLPAYAEDNCTALLGRLYQHYLMNAIKWTIGCKSQAADEFSAALTQLRELRIQEAASRQELLAFCEVTR